MAHYNIYRTLSGSGLFSLLRPDVLVFTACLYPFCRIPIKHAIGSRPLFDVDAALMTDKYHVKVQQYRKKLIKKFPERVDEKYKLDNDIVTFDDYVDVTVKSPEEYAFITDIKLDKDEEPMSDQ